MKKLNLLLILLLMFYSYGCEHLVDHVYRIKVQNNTTDTIRFYASCIYPDTSIVIEKPLLYIAYPNDYGNIDSREKWEDVLPRDTVIVFILSKDTVDAYSWEDIRSNYNILKRYDISIDDLENQKWTVTYP